MTTQVVTDQLGVTRRVPRAPWREPRGLSRREVRQRVRAAVRDLRTDFYRTARARGASRFTAAGYAYFASRPVR